MSTLPATRSISISACLLIAASLLLAHPADAACAKWTATSRTATAITGDITTCPGTLSFGNGTKLKLQFVGNKKGSWAFGSADSAMIYRVTPPSDPLLLNGNTLCGEPVHFIALSPTGDGRLGMTVFGAQLSDFCAVYFYDPR